MRASKCASPLDEGVRYISSFSRMREFPSGSVTFLFTDVEGSAWQGDLGAGPQASATRPHLASLRPGPTSHLMKLVGSSELGFRHVEPVAIRGRDLNAT